MKENEPHLLITDASGIYVPQRFMEEYASEWNLEFVDAESIESLKDVDDENYWDAWIDVTDNATHKDGYTLIKMVTYGLFLLTCQPITIRLKTYVHA